MRSCISTVSFVFRPIAQGYATARTTRENTRTRISVLVIMVVTIGVAVGCAAVVFGVLGARQEREREATIKRSQRSIS
jgi:hypothetical protein